MLAVEAVSIGGHEQETLQVLQLGMCKDSFHQPLADSTTPVFFIDKDIAQPRECGVIGDEPGNANLSLAIIHTEHQGMLQRSLDALTRPLARPVRVGEKFTDGIHVEQRRIGRYKQGTTPDF